MLILIVAGGLDKGRVYELYEDQPTVLGRDRSHGRTSSIKLDDRKISRQHASLGFEDGHWILRDLSSSHGTFRNHEKIQGPTAIEDGDYLQLGGTVLVVASVEKERAERMALLGLPSQGSPAPRQTRPVTPVLLGAAAVLATASGVMAVMYLNRSDQRQAQWLSEARRQQQQLVDTLEQQSQANDALRQEVAQASEAITGTAEQLAPALAKVDGSLSAQQDALTSFTEAQAALTEKLDERAQAEQVMLTRMQARDEVDRELLAQLAVNTRSIEAQQQAVALLAHESKHLRGRLDASAIAKLDNVVELVADQPQRDEAMVSRLGQAWSKDAQATQAVMQEVLAALEASPDTQQLGAMVRQAIRDETQRSAQAIADAAAKLNRDPEVETQALADQITTRLTERAQESDELMRQALALLEDRPDHLDVAEQLRQHLALDQEALAAMIREQVTAALEDQLKDLPSREQLAADIRAVLRHDGRHADHARQRILTQLEQVPDGATLAKDLRLTLAEDSAESRALLRQVLEEIDELPTALDVKAQVAALNRDQADAALKTLTLVSQVLAKLEQRDDVAGELAALRRLMEDQPEAMRQQTEALLAKLDAAPQAVEPAQPAADIAPVAAVAADPQATPAWAEDILTQIAALNTSVKAVVPEEAGPMRDAVDRLDEQVVSQMIAKQVDAAMTKLAQSDHKHQTALTRIEQALDAKPSREEIEALTDATRQQLAELLNDPSQTQALAELRASIDKLGNNLNGDDPMLKQVASVIDQQQDIDAKLTEVRELLDQQPTRTGEDLRRVVEAIKAASSEQTQELLASLLGELRQRVATRDEMRETIRTELRDNMLRHRQAMADAIEVLSVDAPSRPAAPPANPSSPLAETKPPLPATVPGDLPEQVLSPLQSQYRRAFVTGQPITVGQVEDARTGQRVGGRTLDPTAAQQAGFATWRQWFLADRLAERTRAQRLAEDHQRQHAQDGDMIRLPSVSP